MHEIRLQQRIIYMKPLLEVKQISVVNIQRKVSYFDFKFKSPLISISTLNQPLISELSTWGSNHGPKRKW